MNLAHLLSLGGVFLRLGKALESQETCSGEEGGFHREIIRQTNWCIVVRSFPEHPWLVSGMYNN